MTALSDFLRRNRLDDTFLRRLGYVSAVGVIAIGMVTAASALDPTSGNASSPVSGAEIAESLAPHVERTADRLEDMKAIHKALHDDPTLLMPGRRATGKLIGIANELYANTPHPDLAKTDVTRFKSKFDLANHSPAADAATAINAQKLKLAEATRALDDIIQALGHGGRLQEAVQRFDVVVSGINPQAAEMIRTSLDHLRSEGPSVHSVR